MKKRMRSFLLVLMATIFASGGFLGFEKLRDMPIPKNSEYVGSYVCASCHDSVFIDWHNSLHRKMMRRVNEPGVVLADFSPNSENRLFELEKAVWVIGSKWEQQFMGHDGKTETLLPGAWLVKPDIWKPNGWDGWKLPIPLRRCHGCHTVGLNTDTGKFVEPGVGCESCHGSGGWHVKTWGLGKITNSLDAQICGQCHARGHSTDNKYFFPAGYQPGDKLANFFKELLPTPEQNSSQWWGNGRERKRHQEYSTWRQGGHVDSLRSLKENYDGRYGKVSRECLHCHAAEAILANENKGLNLSQAQHGITCAVCHNVHGDLDKPRKTCAACHGDGAYYHQSDKNSAHVICSETTTVTCVDCHMPLTVQNGGGFTLHSHHPKIIPPRDTARYGVPNSCGNGKCHTDKTVEWLQSAYSTHYGEGR